MFNRKVMLLSKRDLKEFFESNSLEFSQPRVGYNHISYFSPANNETPYETFLLLNTFNIDGNPMLYTRIQSTGTLYESYHYVSRLIFQSAQNNPNQLLPLLHQEITEGLLMEESFDYMWSYWARIKTFGFQDLKTAYFDPRLHNRYNLKSLIPLALRYNNLAKQVFERGWVDVSCAFASYAIALHWIIHRWHPMQTIHHPGLWSYLPKDIKNLSAHELNDGIYMDQLINNELKTIEKNHL